MEFSSKIMMVEIIDKKIKLNSTLLDIYKDENIKKAIYIAIQKHDINPFNLLFPYKSAKGKKEPKVLYISNDIYFDYVLSGVNLVDEVIVLLQSINKEFLLEFTKYYKDKQELYNIKTSISILNDSYTLNGVF